MKNKVITVSLAAILVFSLCACEVSITMPAGKTEDKTESVTEVTEKSDDIVESKEDITEVILSYFDELTQIPRPSHHEEKVSAFLYQWAVDRGFGASRDLVNNVIIEIPATEGMEDKPLVGLQVHMDMVFAQADGLNLDPLTTAINTERNGEFLTSDGNTSLGTDDGIGVALVMGVADGKMPHGPVRAIITTDEEDSMSGALGIDSMYFEDLSYLINLDSEEEGVVTVSSAGGVGCSYSLEYEPCEPKYNDTLSIKLSGLTGGHSGEEIKYGRLNAGIVMGSVLDEIRNNGIDFELQYINGGAASNAIMNSIEVIMCIDSEDEEAVETIVNDKLTEYAAAGAETDPDMNFVIRQTKDATEVMPDEVRDAIIDFLINVKDGVNTWLEGLDGLPESSSNIGIISADPAKLYIDSLVRSSNNDRLDEIVNDNVNLADRLGIDLVCDYSLSAWPYKKDNKLLKITTDAYKELFGRDIKLEATHSGLECGNFAKRNQDMDIISIGPTIKEPHTVRERLEIASVEKLWDLLEAILDSIPAD